MTAIRLYKAGEESRSVPTIDSPGWIANGWSTEPVPEPVGPVCSTGLCPVSPSVSSETSSDPIPDTEPATEPVATEPAPEINKRRKR